MPIPCGLTARWCGANCFAYELRCLLFVRKREQLSRHRDVCQVRDVSLVFENTDSAVFRIGNTLINLLKITQANELIEPARVASRESGSRHVFTIEVDDVDAMCAKLVARGATLVNGPMDRPWGIRTASFSDPGGHIWEIAK